MGTDISLHVEVKLQGRWLHYSAPHVVRDYAVFRKIGGVRMTEDSEEVPIGHNRGVPEDASEITSLIYKLRGGHDASFLTREEIVAFSEWFDGHIKDNQLRYEHVKFHGLDGVIGYLFGDPITSLGEIYEDKKFVGTAFEDVRFIFWFQS